MRAGLGHQHAVAGPQPLDGQRPFDELAEVALLPGEEDRERGHLHLRRRVGRDLQERLRIGHHQGRRAVQPAQGVAQLPLLDHQAIGVAVQQVADRLHLGHDQPALGRFHVDGHHQHGHLARRNQVGHQRRRAEEILGRRLNQRLAQFQHAAALGGDRFDERRFRLRAVRPAKPPAAWQDPTC